MIILGRNLVRKFLTVLRCSVWAASGNKRLPPVLFEDRPQGLTLSSQHQGIAVSLTEPGCYSPQSFALAGEVLKDFEDHGKEIGLEEAHPGFVMVFGKDGSEQCYPTLDIDGLPPFPTCPDCLQPQEQSFIAALSDAMSTGAYVEGFRYKFAEVQLRGSGVLIGTDGRELLWQEGFDLPWTEDVLVPRVKAFGCKELRYEPAAVGKTDSHVLVKTGLWTIALPVDPDPHYPEVERVLPNGIDYASRWRLSSAEVSFLLRQLPRLPFEEEGHGAVTLDLDETVCIRSREPASGCGRELVLPRSEMSGPSLRLVTDRRYLKHALELGFREIAFGGGSGPAWCQDNGRQFLWMCMDRPYLERCENDERVTTAE